MQWKLDLLLWPRDQETEFPVEARLMIPFFDRTGMIYMHWVPAGQTVNK